MKLHELFIHETWVVGNLSKNADEYALAQKDKWKQHPHVGDIDKFSVRHQGVQYSVWDKDKLIASAELHNGNPSEVKKIWTNKAYRGKKILSRLLWFFKSRENKSRLLLGNMHSSDTQEVVKHRLSQFTKSWFKNGEQKPFSLDTLDQFYSKRETTGWQLMLENFSTFKHGPKWPRYTTGKNWITESYDWQIM